MRTAQKIGNVLGGLNSGFDSFIANTDYMVATVVILVLLITFRNRIGREMMNLCVFVLTAIIFQLMTHDILISGLAAFLVMTVYNVGQQNAGTLEMFTEENDKINKIVEKLESDSKKISESVISDKDMDELMKDEMGDDDDSAAAKERREKMKVDKLSPSEAQRELFKLVDVGAQLSKQMEQMVPGLKKAGTVMKMLKGMKNV